jgi:hypothetical protein
MTVHHVKSTPEFFSAVWCGLKTAELRNNDRDYEVGDELIQHEWSPPEGDNTGYTGRQIRCKITHITATDHLAENNVMLSFAGIQCIRANGVTSHIIGYKLLYAGRGIKADKPTPFIDLT